MIISEKLGFAFIHIPKCAGTSVREAIEQHDESYARMTAGLTPHPHAHFTYSLDRGLSYLDFHHLTLRHIARHFPEELERLERLKVFALLREPRKRLLSSVLQRLKQFHGVAVADLSAEALRTAMHQDLEELDRLLRADRDLPYQFIHFQPQADFIELGGGRIAQEVFATDQIAQFEFALMQHAAEHGEEIAGFADRRANTTKAHRFSALESVVQKNTGIKHAAKALVPAALKPALRRMVYTAQGARHDHLLDDEIVERFVQQHYARDIELFEAARAKAA